MTEFRESDCEARRIREAQKKPAEFRHLYDAWVGRIYRYILFRVGQVADAEDLTSQVFLAAYQALPRYQHNGRFGAWLFAIARNRVRTHFRKPGKDVPLEQVEFDASAEHLPGQLEDLEERRRLRDLVRQLPEDEQELIRLRYTAELAFADMAAVLGRREDAVKKSLYRLQEKLKHRLEETHG